MGSLSAQRKNIEPPTHLNFLQKPCAMILSPTAIPTHSQQAGRVSGNSRAPTGGARSSSPLPAVASRNSSYASLCESNDEEGRAPASREGAQSAPDAAQARHGPLKRNTSFEIKPTPQQKSGAQLGTTPPRAVPSKFRDADTKQRRTSNLQSMSHSMPNYGNMQPDEQQAFENACVAHIMPAVDILADKTLGDANDLLLETSITSNNPASLLCVVSPTNSCVGVLTLKDVQTILSAKGGQPSDPISKWMSTPAVAVNPETPVQAAAALMLAYSISHVPVVDAQNTLIGVVSSTSLVRPLLGSGYSAAFLPLFAARPPGDLSHRLQQQSSAELVATHQQQHASSTTHAQSHQAVNHSRGSIDHLEDGLDDALEDAMRDALSGLSHDIHIGYSLNEVPGLKHLSKVLDHAGSLGRAGSSHIEGSAQALRTLFDADNVVAKTVQAVLEKVDAGLGKLGISDIAHTHFGGLDAHHLAGMPQKAALETLNVVTHSGHLLKGVPAVLKLLATLESSWALDLALLPLLAPVVATAYSHIMKSRERLGPMWEDYRRKSSSFDSQLLEESAGMAGAPSMDLAAPSFSTPSFAMNPRMMVAPSFSARPSYSGPSFGYPGGSSPSFSLSPGGAAAVAAARAMGPSPSGPLGFGARLGSPFGSVQVPFGNGSPATAGSGAT